MFRCVSTLISRRVSTLSNRVRLQQCCCVPKSLHKFLFSIRKTSYNDPTSNFPLKINLFVRIFMIIKYKICNAEKKVKIEFLHFTYASSGYPGSYIYFDKPYCRLKVAPWTFGPSLFHRDKLWAARWLTLVVQNSSEREILGYMWFISLILIL